MRRTTTMMALVALSWIWLAGVAWAAKPVGFVAAVRGEAEVVRGEVSLPARIGLALQQGDRLVTGERGRLKLLLSDDSVVALGSHSQVELGRHLFDPAAKARTTRLQLLGGSLRALVQKVVGDTAADFEVRSGTAVAGVRGTEFALLADPAGPRLVTFSGAVAWAAAGAEPVRVEAGQHSRMGAGRPQQPEALAAAELEAVRRATDARHHPDALAWNLQVDDRITPPGPGRQPAGGSPRDAREQATELEAGQRDYPGHRSGDDGPEGGSFGADGGQFQDNLGGEPADGPLPEGTWTGSWRGSADVQPPLAGSGYQVELRVNVNLSNP